MQRQLDAIGMSLVDVRAEAARALGQLVNRSDEATLAQFLICHCYFASTMMGWLSNWAQQLVQSNHVDEQVVSRAFLQTLIDRLYAREVALKQDQRQIVKHLSSRVQSPLRALTDGLEVTPGMKQLREIFQGSVSTHHIATWVCIMLELERCRLLHGMTLMKLAQSHFGPGILRYFSHVHLMHQQDTPMLNLLEDTLVAMGGQVTDAKDMLNQSRLALQAYIHHLEHCFDRSQQMMAAT